MCYIKTSGKLTLVFFLIVLCACGKISEQRKMHYFEKGKALYEKGEYDKAIREFENAQAFDPLFFDAYYLGAMANYKRGNFENAMAWFMDASNLQPENIEVRFYIIESAVAIKKWGPVITTAESILKADKSNKDALYFNLFAKIKLRKDKRIAQARDVIAIMMQQGCEDPRIYCLDAEIKILLGDLLTAETILAQHKTSHKIWIETMKMLAGEYEQKQNIKKTIELYESIIDNIEDKHPLQKELVEILLKNKKTAEAELFLKDMTRIYPEDQQDMLNLIACLTSLNKLDEADQIINAEIKKDPENFVLRKAFIEVHEKRGAFDKTIEVAQEMLATLKNNLVQSLAMKNIIADIYFKNSKYEESKSYSKDILTADPKDLQARFNLLKIVVRESKDPVSLGTIGDLRLLINDNPGDPDYYYYLSIAHKTREENIMAEKALCDALDRRPEHKEALLSLADLYLPRGMYSSIKRRLEEYLKRNPDDAEIVALLERVKKKTMGMF